MALRKRPVAVTGRLSHMFLWTLVFAMASATGAELSKVVPSGVIISCVLNMTVSFDGALYSIENIP